MGKINSRDKGKRFELTLAHLFEEHGYEAHRSAQFCGKTGQAADVIGVPGIHVEAKAQERMCLYDWMDQAIRDSRAEGKGNKPTVFHKQNRKDLLVTMMFDDWMELYKAWDKSNLPFTEDEDDRK